MKNNSNKKNSKVGDSKSTDNQDSSTKQHNIKEEYEELVRIMSFDIPGTRKVYAGLTRIKGVGWTISNAVCRKLKIPSTKKIGDLTKEEIKKIEETLKNLNIPEFLKNRQKDNETGETSHFYGTDLQLKRDFDIKRLKKIRSYKGIRHSLKLPVRGQRTKANFRKNKKVAGMKPKIVKKIPPKK